MRADDDGFVSNARTIQRLVGASDDDIKLLLMKRFLLPFESGVVVIKHWRINNYVRGDRYTPTLYQEEKSQLYVKKNGVYTDHPILPLPPAEAGKLPPESPADFQPSPDGLPNDIPNGDKRDTQDRVGEGRSGEVSQDKVNSSGGGDTRARTRESAEKEVDEYLQGRQLDPAFAFGVPEKLLSDVALLAEAIFKEFTTRRPTKADVANVFMCIRDQEYDEDAGEWKFSIPQNKKDILMYAFEQAALSGKAGDWKYINGILANLHKRGITSLDKAEDYESERGGM